MIRFFLFLMLFHSALFSQIVLNNNKSVYDNFTLEYIYDEKGEVTIDELDDVMFSKSTPSRFTFGYLSGTTWFKMSLKNQSENTDFVIEFKEALWDKFDFYYPKDGKMIKISNGLNTPLSKRTIRDVMPAFLLHIDKNSSTTVYFQGRTIASQIGHFKIFSSKEYFNPTRLSLTHIYVIFAFIMLSIVLLNIYNYILTSEKIYFYYVSYIVVFIIFSSMQSGTYMILGFNGWSEGLHVMGTFVNISLILFTNKFFELKSQMPYIHYFFKISIGVFLLFAILIFENIPYSGLLFNLYSVLFYVMLFIMAIRLYLKGSIEAKYYLVALIIYTPLMSLMILNFNALLDYSPFTRHIYLAGSFIEILFFTLILTNRYRQLNVEKIKIQKQLLDEQSNYETTLKREIFNRTKDLEDTQKELKTMVVTDNLTKLYNRYKIDEVLKEEYERTVRYAEPFGLILIDIDDFKKVNDNYGHQVGDNVLVTISNTIKSNIRKVDTAARWGGEEFIVICPQTNIEGIKKIAENIRQKFESNLIDPIGRQTASFGVSQYQNNETIDMLITRADDALYKAKNSGKNCVC